jgi:hypothetical protein
MAFRREAIVLEDGRPFGAVMEPWQAEDFAALDDPAHRHAYLERPRGHSKTGDIATEAVVELVLGPPHQRLYCAAADEDQAGLLFQDVLGKFQRNPLLAPLIKPTRRVLTVPSLGSTLTVLASDAPSAYGLRPNWIAVDELSEWRRRELWDSLWSATGKRPRCRMLVISTAGWDRTSLAWEVRSIAEGETDWYFSSRGPCASWISEAWRDQQQRTLPPHVFARLHRNQWVEGVGAFLTAAEVDGIFVEALPAARGQAAYGLDLGLAKDRTVLSRVRHDARTSRLVVEALETWTPRPGAHVDLMDVEETVATLVRAHPAPVYLDPWQGVLLGQRLRGRGLDVHEVSFTGESRRKLFGVVLDLVRTGRLRCRPHADLRRELLGLEVQETAVGWRVDHRPGRHDDHVVAIALAAHAVATWETGGGPVPIIGETIRMDLARWTQRPGTAAYNTGLFDWRALDAEDVRRRQRAADGRR